MSIDFRRNHPQVVSLTAYLATALLTPALIISPGAAQRAAQGAENDPASLTSLRHQTRQLLRHEAALDDGPAKDAAVTALCDLYVVLRNDRRYQDSRMLQADTAKIRRRLLGAASQRKARLKRAGVPRPSGLAAKVDAEIKASLKQGADTNGPIDRDPATAGGGAMNNAWQLIELIQRVVAPDFWDRQGGPGTIKYFAMRRVLVVRATSDVHQQIKDLLIALR